MKQCSKCHLQKDFNQFYKDKSKRDGLRPDCKECKNKYIKQYKVSYPEKIKETRKTHYDKNAEQIKKYVSEWQKENKEKVNTNSSKYRKTEKGRLTTKRKNHRRRALEKTTVGFLPKDYWTILINIYGQKCINRHCIKIIDDLNPLSLDHIIPLSRGGLHDLFNIQILCRSCNSTKRDRSSTDFRPFKLEDVYERIS